MGTRVVRGLALVVVLLALVAAAIVLLGGRGSTYEVTGRFTNSSQLVKGNLVQVAGRPVGEVTDLKVSDDGQAIVKMTVNDDFAPLREGTLATIRQSSLSSVANRYVDLRLGRAGAKDIPDGGVLPRTATTSTVDLDQLFNTIDGPTREDLKGVFQGLGVQYDGASQEIAAGLRTLDPALAASTRLFKELNRDEPFLERFVVANAKLVTDLSERQEDLTGLVAQGAQTAEAISAERGGLAEGLDDLPAFMRRANSTFVNLRATLDDLDPLVTESRPVARKLRPLLAELRPFARDARPTLRDLSRAATRPGRDNDLIDVFKRAEPLDRIATQTAVRNGKRRPGAFPASTKALRDSVDPVAFFRPYTPDLLGWFDDFSHTGIYDALGAASRVAPHVNAFLFANGQLTAIPPNLRDEVFNGLASRENDDRCPGSADQESPETGNVFKPSEDFPCTESQVLPGR